MHEDDELLDDQFPLGDGTADTAGVVICPYCGEENEISLDPGGGAVQEYVEDCRVCCRAWHVTVRFGKDGSATIDAEPEDGG